MARPRISKSSAWRRLPKIQVAALGCLLLFGASTGTAFSVGPAPEAGPAKPMEVPPPDEALNFLTRRTVLWLGRSQVIPVRMKDDAPADDELEFPVTTPDPGLVEILRPATVLAGEKLGFLRVRALKAGRTRLEVRGGELEVEIRNDPAAAVFVRPRPRIIGPLEGATVWGKFAIGVEMFEATPHNEVREEQETPAASPPVELQLPNGQRLEPVAGNGMADGPVRRLTFELSADELPPGPLRLVAVATSEDGARSESDPVNVTVVRSSASGALLAGACADSVEKAPQLLASLGQAGRAGDGSIVGPVENENDAFDEVLGETLKLFTPPRPKRFGNKKPKTGPLPGSESSRVILAYSGDRSWSLPFQVPAAGRYQLFLRARGDEAEGVLPSVALYINEGDQPVALGRLVERDWHRMPLGAPFQLEAGAQTLTVQFKNDFAVRKEDRNLFLDRYELLRLPGEIVRPKQDESAKMSGTPSPQLAPLNARPSVAILYPRDGQNLFGADVVIARLTVPPGRKAAWADVLLDDQPLGLRIEKPAADQPLVFPLPVRGVVGPSHHLRVRVTDEANDVEDSPAQFVNFLSGPPSAPGPYERAVRLLNRFAYGPEPKELAAVLTMGEQNWLNDRLEAGFSKSAAEDKTLARAIEKYPRLDDGGQTIQRALFQAIHSDNPVRTRFTAFIENHFNTWINKTSPALKWHEHVEFARLGIAPFADLLDASARSPAMLVYLDQEKSYAEKLNENYAREIMELHTLGVHAGYSQADVTTMASLLTGWTLANEARIPLPGEEQMRSNGGNDAGMEKDFRYDALLNDGKARQVFGISFDETPPEQRYDRVCMMLEFLGAHPATAEHICRKLADYYAGAPAPDALVRELTQVYLEEGGDMRSVLRALASNPLFWSSSEHLATPQDYALRLARLLRSTDPTPDGSKSVKPQDVERFLKMSGMGLFDRVTPDGYPEQDAAYADSNALLQRWRFAQSLGGLISNLVPASWRQPPPRSETTTLPASAFDAPQRLIDIAALRLTGRLLSPTSNKAALDLLGPAPTPEQAQAALVFVSLLPEANLR